jgi:hypothetical protein
VSERKGAVGEGSAGARVRAGRGGGAATREGKAASRAGWDRGGRTKREEADARTTAK